jgi:hypothetical protein
MMDDNGRLRDADHVDVTQPDHHAMRQTAKR